MKALKIIGLVLVGIIVLLLVTGLFVNGKYAVEREITIQKPKAEVFALITNCISSNPSNRLIMPI